MKHLIKRSFALLMALVLVFSLLPGISLHSYAMDYETVVDETTQYMYNWGERGVLADALSANAQAFYTGDYTYENLIAMEGSTTAVDTSVLYTALYTLMSAKHTTLTSYADIRTLTKYTDCQKNDGTSISLIYSGATVSSDWDSGKTWNREHLWPDSLGGSTDAGSSKNNESDIMIIRPEDPGTNTSRNNKAYGNETTTTHYYPNLTSYDVRGDVARSILYAYVRWGTVQDVKDNIWNVIESQEVLLDWIADDPVDTWEMGRNDAVQSITGTRNVFVDYPELAFTLFGEDVPEDMLTPSGDAIAVSFYENDKFVKSEGVEAGTEYTLPTAPTNTPPAGYTFAGWVEAPVEETSTAPATIYEGGAKVTISASTNFYALLKLESASATTNYTLVTSDSSLEIGATYIIAAKDYAYAMSATQGSNNRGQIDIVKNDDNTLETPADTVEILTLKAGTTDGTYAFYTGEGYLYAASSGSNYLKTETTLSDNSSWTIEIASDGTATVKAQGTNTRNWLRYNSGNSIFSCYSSGQKDIVLYKEVTTGAGTTYTTYTDAAWTAPVYVSDGADYLESNIKKPANGMTLPATITVNGETMTVSWSVAAADGYTSLDDGSATISDSTLVLTSQSLPVNYTLIADIYYEGASARVQWKATVAPIGVTTFAGNYVLSTADGKALTTYDTTSSKYGNLGVTEITITNGEVTNPDVSIIFTLTGNEDGTYYIQDNADNYLAASTGDYYNFILSTSTYAAKWLIGAYDGGYYLYNTTSERGVGYNESYNSFAQYDYTNAYSILTLTATCNHTDYYDDTTVAASCTTDGLKQTICEDCEYVLGEEVIPATGHTFENNVCTVCGEKKADGYVKKDLADIEATDKVIITMTTSSGNMYALFNGNGTSSAPKAVAVSESEVNKLSLTQEDETLEWNIANDGSGNLTIYKVGSTDTWLYCTGTNNGTRVGTNEAKVFTIEGGYLKHTGTGRYVGVYNASDWRCYTTNTTANIANQTLAFYVWEGGSCTHEYSDEDWVVTKEPTCTEAGVKERSCTLGCGQKETEAVPAPGHNYENLVCTRCGDELESFAGNYYIAAVTGTYNYHYLEGAMNGSRYNAVDSGSATVPTAPEFADKTKTFTLALQTDGTYLIQVYGTENYLGWTSGNYGKLVNAEEARAVTVTKNENGTYLLSFPESETSTNTRCLALHSESGYFAWYGSTTTMETAMNLIPVTVCQHEGTVVTDAAEPASCTATGLTEGSHCSACNEIIVAQEVVPFAHTPNEGVVTAPTCTTAGYTTYTCTECGEEYTADEVPALGHSYGDGVVSAPTCSLAGYTTYTCTVCGETKKEETSEVALGHNLVEGVCDREGCTFVVPTTSTAIVDEAYNLVAGETLAGGTYTLTGKITSIDEAYSTQYSNITVTIAVQDREDKLIKCFRLTGTGADTLAVDDVITVTGTIKNYNGTVEFDSGCTLDSVLKDPIAGQSVILSDDIGMYLTTTENLTTDAVITATIGAGDAKEYTLDSDKGITIPVAAAQMNDEIDVYVDGVWVGTYSVKAYAKAIIDDTTEAYTDAEKTLVKNMLMYGGAAQTYFAYNDAEGNLASNDITDVTLTAPEGESALKVENSVDGLYFYGATLVHENKTAVRFYFSGDITDVATTGEIVTVEKDGKTLHYIEVDGINPQDMDNHVTVTVTKGEQTMTVTYSALTYIVRMYGKSEEGSALSDLMKAMYGYYQAAESYIDSLNTSAT